MANSSTDELKVLSETDLLSPLSNSLALQSDDSSIHENRSSWRYLAKTYFNNSKQRGTSISNVFIKENLSSDHYKNLPGAMPIMMNDILKAQNSNAPWLLKIFRKKFHRSQKNKNDFVTSKDVDAMNSVTLAEELLEKAITNDGSSGKWIVEEKDVFCPLVKNFEASVCDQFNVSRAMSSSSSPNPTSTEDSLQLRHYQYDFQAVDTQIVSLPSFSINYPLKRSSTTPEDIQQQSSNDEDTKIDPISMISMTETLHTSNQDETKVHQDQEKDNAACLSTLVSKEKSPIDDIYLANANSTMDIKSKRAKSSSATRSQRVISSMSSAKDKERSRSMKKKKNKHCQEHTLSCEEIELREALRIIDLDNIGFFSPNELRKALRDIGINPHDIEKIERCLPLDDDGHYSMDNLVKLLLTVKSS